MGTPQSDVAFKAETQVEDQPNDVSPSAVSSGDSDAIARDKERLRRFHMEAMSFLTKAYSNDNTVLIEDGCDNRLSPKRSNNTRVTKGSSGDFLAKRRIELDKIRLERFHAQAVSFLDRAYSNEPETIVIEEPLSTGFPSVTSQNKEILQRFHNDTMNLLNAVARGAPLTVDGNEGDEHAKKRHGKQGADNTLLRIERDRARLEQHYQDTMSFLERADAEKKDVLVEEQELEHSTVDRLQLQRYAKEAMSFLDKAFRNDASVIVCDEDDGVLLHEQEEGTEKSAELHASNGCGHESLHSPAVPMPAQTLSDNLLSRLASSRAEEDLQIAADRLALERCDAEIGDFLSKAYLDDASVMIEDANSETSEPDRGLFARRVAPSDSSMDSGSSPVDNGYESANTDDEFQDHPLRESTEPESPPTGHPAGAPRLSLGKSGNSGSVALEDRTEGTCLGKTKHICDATDNANSTCAVGDTEPNSNAASRDSVGKQASGEEVRNEVMVGHRHIQGISCDRYNNATPQAVRSRGSASDGTDRCLNEFKQLSTMDGDRVEAAIRPTAGTDVRTLPKSRNLLVDVVLEDSTGHTQEWSEVPLQSSFYRQLPRGSSVKLRPHARQGLSTAGATKQDGAYQRFHEASLRRMENERDCLMLALEEIVNERSRLAAEVREIKDTIQGAGGWRSGQVGDIEEKDDIDLASELREAHATMSKLTEEMEATLGVLEERNQETLERALEAEERCIRMKSDASNLQDEFSKQGVRLSQAITEQTRLQTLLAKSEKEFAALVKKYEMDMNGLQQGHREDLDRYVNKILLLTNEVSTLQESLKLAGAGNVAQSLPSPSTALPHETALLKSQVADTGQSEVKERLAKETVGREDDETRLEREGAPNNLSAHVQDMPFGAQDDTAVRRNLRQGVERSSGRNDLEETVEELQRQVKEAKSQQLAAQAEARHVQSRYEEFLERHRSQVGENAEMTEWEAALKRLQDEAGEREQKLQGQLSDFRLRAEQAEAAASRAERDAREAAEAARITKERSLIAVESEREARRAAEAEKNTIVMESKAWEKFAQQQLHLSTEDESSTVVLSKSSSRRGIRRSPSKQFTKESSKRTDAAKGGGVEKKSGISSGEDSAKKKKNSRRPRLFG